MTIASCGNYRTQRTRPGPKSRPFFHRPSGTAQVASHHCEFQIPHRQSCQPKLRQLCLSTVNYRRHFQLGHRHQQYLHRRAHAEQQQAGHRPPGCCPSHRHHFRTALEARKPKHGDRARGRLGQTSLLLGMRVCLQALQLQLPQPRHQIS